MKKLSRRKFVGQAVMTGAGVTILSDVTKTESVKAFEINSFKDAASKGSSVSGKQLGNSVKETFRHDFGTMRPIRNKYRITVTVGQSDGDFRGNDDKILQAAVDYVFRLGGGTVNILPGIYAMRNSLFPRSGVNISGSGEKTILRKSASVSSKIIREADWFEYCVQVEDPKGFSVGGGVALSTDKKDDQKVDLFTITAIQDNILFLDQRTEKNFWMMEGARASTRFSIINGRNVDDVNIENIVLDGNKEENEHVNDNYCGAVFMQYCNRWNFKNVTAGNYNSDGFSFQVCDDIHFEDCLSLNNADLGFHPGSGSQRPVFKRCTSKGNSQGFFWCWGACDGIAEDCVASGNRRFGVNFGHRDTDNILKNCLIENNKEVGVLFRKEPNEYRLGDRNTLENCIIRNNGIGIDIQWKTRDITIRNCTIENVAEGPQKTGIRISPEAQNIVLQRNTFKGTPVEVEDQRKKG
jgi:parallel beta-helix repeat protein